MTFYRDGLVLQRLQDEIGDDAAVVHVHARPIRVEDARHAHLHALLFGVGVAQRLRHPLALVVTRPRSCESRLASISRHSHLSVKSHKAITASIEPLNDTSTWHVWHESIQQRIRAYFNVVKV